MPTPPITNPIAHQDQLQSSRARVSLARTCARNVMDLKGVVSQLSESLLNESDKAGKVHTSISTLINADFQKVQDASGVLVELSVAANGAKSVEQRFATLSEKFAAHLGQIYYYCGFVDGFCETDGHGSSTQMQCAGLQVIKDLGQKMTAQIQKDGETAFEGLDGAVEITNSFAKLGGVQKIEFDSLKQQVRKLKNTELQQG